MRLPGSDNIRMALQVPLRNPGRSALTALGLAIGVGAFIAMVSIWTPLSDPRIADRWFTWPNLAYLAPLPIATGFIALWLWRALDSQRDIAPFFAAIGLFALCFLGLGISLWPNIVPPNISLWEAAASPRAQAFLLIGTLFLLPIIVAYTAWVYKVLWGKVDEKSVTDKNSHAY